MKAQEIEKLKVKATVVQLLAKLKDAIRRRDLRGIKNTMGYLKAHLTVNGDYLSEEEVTTINETLNKTHEVLREWNVLRKKKEAEPQRDENS